MPEEATSSTTSTGGGRAHGPMMWWVISAAVVVAVIAAAFVVVPRVTGAGPRAEAADITNWEGGCQNNLTNGDTREGRSRGQHGYWLNCNGQEAYVGKRGGGQADCLMLRVNGLFISDSDLEGVVAIKWDQFRGWNTQGGREAAGPGGTSNLQTQQKAAGAIIGVRENGSIKFDHQYGSNVAVQLGATRPCFGGNP